MKFLGYTKLPVDVMACRLEQPTTVPTAEGILHAEVGDYLIIGIRGEIYLVKAAVFPDLYSSKDDPDLSVEQQDTLLRLSSSIAL
jgi:hypothetical protein